MFYFQSMFVLTENKSCIYCGIIILGDAEVVGEKMFESPFPLTLRGFQYLVIIVKQLDWPFFTTRKEENLEGTWKITKIWNHKTSLLVYFSTCRSYNFLLE